MSMTWLLLMHKVPRSSPRRRVALAAFEGHWQSTCRTASACCRIRPSRPPGKDAGERCRQMEGEAVILETVALYQAQEDRSLSRFKADRDEEYPSSSTSGDDFEADRQGNRRQPLHLRSARGKRRRPEKLQAGLDKIKKLRLLDARSFERRATGPQGLRGTADEYAKRSSTLTTRTGEKGWPGDSFQRAPPVTP